MDKTTAGEARTAYLNVQLNRNVIVPKYVENTQKEKEESLAFPTQ
jgi:hypothetical protein